MAATTTVTGTPGTAIAAACTGPTAGTIAQAGDVNTALTSIENDLATIREGSYTCTAAVGGSWSITGTCSYVSGASFVMVAGSTSSINAELTLGASVVTKVISGATNATPIVITTATAHGFLTGDQIIVESILGNIAANGLWVVKFLNGTQFSLVGSAGSGAYTSGGDCYRLPAIAFNSARAVTRVLSSPFHSGYSEGGAITQGWSCDNTGEFACANSSPTTTVQYIGYAIDIPHGSSLVSGTIYMQPAAGHGGTPGTLPTVNVIKVALSGNVLTTLATASLSGIDPAYQGVTATLGTAEILDRTRYRYAVILTTETGVNALDNTHVMGGACSFTARHVEQF